MNHGSSIVVLVLSVALASACGGKGGEGAKADAGANANAGANAGELGSSAPAAGAEHAGAQKTPATPTLDEAVEYSDAGTARKLWISKELVAEFNPSDAGKAAILGLDANAQEVPQPQPVVRLWKLTGPERGEAFATAATSPLVRVSPVLHEGPSEGLPIRALPGGVIVTFKPDWDRARMDAWLALRSLAIQGEPVVAETNTFLVGTAPGLAEFAVAKELLKTGEFVDVVPNFWRQNTAK